MDSHKVITGILFLLMLGIIIDQHLKLMRSFELADRAIAVAEQWHQIALGR